MKFLLWISSDCHNLTEIAGALKAGGHDLGLLLVQDGVYLADKGCPESETLLRLGAPIHATRNHVEERGIEARLVVDVEPISYEDAVDLIMEQYDRVISL
ncbi:MAG: DsrH/TusB family sulfur relay protein [Candidatus Thorarchaeota archaeon]